MKLMFHSFREGGEKEKKPLVVVEESRGSRTLKEKFEEARVLWATGSTEGVNVVPARWGTRTALKYGLRLSSARVRGGTPKTTLSN